MGVSSTRGRDCGGLTECGVGRASLLAYVAGNVHRWDLRRPGLSGTRLILEVPHGRRADLYFSRPVQPVFTDAERLALAGYLAGYRGLTREAYTLDLRQFTGWCRALPLFLVRRADIEIFARELEAKGRARATVTRRLSTIAGFYKYAVEEELLARRPRPSAAAGLRVARHRPGPQRGRRAAGRRRARARHPSTR